jgi:SAM-dependent methyltransferase
VDLETRSCTLCGPHAKKTVKYTAHFAPTDLNSKVFSARRGPDRKHFRLVKCAECGIIYSDPACDPSKLERLYEQSNVTYSDQEAQIYSSYAPVLDQALSCTAGRGSFVEVGGGPGFMLRYGVERGFKTQTEVEPSRDAKRMFVPPGPAARFICEVFSGTTLPKNSASLICFFQVLDHLPNPKKFLTDVWEALEPGGVAVGITHNTQALSAKLLGRASPIFDIEHTYLFNHQNIRQLFSKSGFAQVTSFGIANTYSAKYWANLLPASQGVRQQVQKGLRLCGLADRQIPLRAGNLAALGIKPLIH